MVNFVLGVHVLLKGYVHCLHVDVGPTILGEGGGAVVQKSANARVIINSKTLRNDTI